MLKIFVRYSSRLDDDEKDVCQADGLEDDEDDDHGHDHGDEHKEALMANGDHGSVSPAELWDLLRPLIGNCHLRLLKFEDKEGKVRCDGRETEILVKDE